MFENTEHFESYIAGFADGDASICIGKCKGGFQLKIEFTQCNKLFLQNINSYFDDQGKIYTDSRVSKYKNEQASSLRFCGGKSLPLLKIMIDKAIIKAEQAKYAIDYLQIVNKQNMYNEKEIFYNKMKQLNADKSSYEKNYANINFPYIAGLFDAEGNVYSNDTGKRFKYYVKITQKSDPNLLVNIQDYLKYGNISKSENFRLRFHSKANIIKFNSDISTFCIIKKTQLTSLVEKLNKSNIDLSFSKLSINESSPIILKKILSEASTSESSTKKAPEASNITQKKIIIKKQV